MRLFLIFVLAFSVLAAPAHALDLVTEIDANGDPLVSATEPVTWSTGATGVTIAPGEQPEGTVFTATTAGGETASTAPWGGRVTMASPPSLVGTAAVGETVKPVAATWKGGWGTEVDDLRIEACFNPTTCFTVSAPDWIDGGDGSVVLAPDTATWMLRVADRRRNRNEVRPTVVYTDPSQITPLTPGPLVAYSAFSAPTAYPPPATPTVSAPDIAPLDPTFTQPMVVFRKRALRRASGLVVGSVACPKACVIKLSVSDARHTFTRTFSGQGPSHVGPVSQRQAALRLAAREGRRERPHLHGPREALGEAAPPRPAPPRPVPPRPVPPRPVPPRPVPPRPAPASSRPASARPASARPASARPASARPASARSRPPGLAGSSAGSPLSRAPFGRPSAGADALPVDTVGRLRFGLVKGWLRQPCPHIVWAGWGVWPGLAWLWLLGLGPCGAPRPRFAADRARLVPARPPHARMFVLINTLAGRMIVFGREVARGEGGVPLHCRLAQRTGHTPQHARANLIDPVEAVHQMVECGRSRSHAAPGHTPASGPTLSGQG